MEKMNDVSIIRRWTSDMEDLLNLELEKVGPLFSAKTYANCRLYFGRSTFSFAKVGIPALYIGTEASLISKKGKEYRISSFEMK